MGPARKLGHLSHPIQHGAPDPMVGERLKPHSALGIEPMVGLEQASKAERDQIVELAAERELTPEAVGESMHHLFVRRDEFG
jgi:hypothetical protein